MISKDDLLYFIEVTHTLNFSRASERIGISQPSLSAAIKRLEESIGTDLFIRHKKGVTLTPAGKELQLHSKQLLQYWETVKTSTLAAAYKPQGIVTLGCHPSIGLFCLSEFLPSLLEKYPNLTIQVKHDLSRIIVESVINLSVDIGIVANPVKYPNLIIQTLYTDEVAFWHTDNGEKIEDLFSGEATIVCNPDFIQTGWLLKQLTKKGINYSRIITSNNLELVGKLSANGCGIAILPATIASQYKQLKQIPNMITYPDEICLVYRPENKDIMVIKTVITAIKQYFA